MSQITFPEDLNEDFYPECIRFGIYQRDGVGLDVVKNKLNKAKEQIDGIANQKAGTTIADSIGNGSSGSFDATKPTQQNKELSEAEKLALQQKVEKRVSESNIITDVISGLTRQSRSQFKAGANGLGVESSIASIYLQMPDSVPAFNEQVDWSSSDMGIIGAAISASSGGDGAIGKTLESGILSNAGNILGGGIGAILGGGSLGATVLGTILGGESSVQTAVETLSSSKANPFKEQTFQGIGFRSFSFSFNMRARNQDEVNSIRDIIEAFRAYSKPSFKDGNAGVFKYPHEFLIEFLKVQGGGYVKNEYLPELKYCVCTNVTTNYTSVNWKSFKNGAPVDINLSLSFQETEIITQEDVLGKTQVGRFKGSKRRF